ncbi:MAG: hypothetical protein COB30_018845 [Ectothiorhodospiraceae bacterium]|nr:hypothetical protein [Ectothiorhodospiraceae bacterium]
MANGITNKLNRSLELTLRDSLDGLEEFTLMMASASLPPQFETLTITPVPKKPSPTPLSSHTPSIKWGITVRSNKHPAKVIPVPCNQKKKLA